MKTDIISIHDFSKKQIIRILELAKKMETNKKPLLANKVLATLFYEPSTRTRLSFESAMKQLGGKTIGFAEPKATSMAKGESLHDTIKMVEGYADIIVIRHYLEGAARLAAESTNLPVINAGDGSNQHPTQTFLDLFTIKKVQGKISNLNIGFLGDLKYGRTVHSLVTALSLFDCKMTFISPENLKIPENYLTFLSKKNIDFIEKSNVDVKDLDILYVTRIQKERFPDPVEYEKVKNAFILDKSILKEVKKNFRIMHPLPRVNEIHPSLDNTGYDIYFQQAHNGIPTRQALLSLCLDKIK